MSRFRVPLKHAPGLPVIIAAIVLVIVTSCVVICWLHASR